MPSSVPSNRACLMTAVIIESGLAHTCWSTQTAGGCMRTQMMSLSSMHYIAIKKQCSLNILCKQNRNYRKTTRYVPKYREWQQWVSPKVTTCQSRWMWERRVFIQKRCDQQGTAPWFKSRTLPCFYMKPCENTEQLFKGMEAFIELSRMDATNTTWLTMSEPCPASCITETFKTLGLKHTS